MEILLVLVVGILMLLAFYMGKHEKEEVSPINTIEKVQERIEQHKEKVEAREEKKERDNQIKNEMYNIDNYDGTGFGQKEI